MYPEFDCVDCGKSTFKKEYYMVLDCIWEEAGMGSDDGMLCIKCLESRLFRPLTEDDFTGAPVNYMFFSRNTERFPEGVTKFDKSGWTVLNL